MAPVQTMHIALLVAFIFFLALGLFDLYLVIRKGTGSSISNAFVNLGMGRGRFSIFALGTCVGHLFFYMYPASENDPFTTRMLDGGCGAVAAICILYLISGNARRSSLSRQSEDQNPNLEFDKEFL